jgi:hypothetical protein
MAVNEILQFAPNGVYDEHLLTFTQYRDHPRRNTGFAAGELADQCLANTALKNLSVFAAGLAQYLVDTTGTDVRNNVTPAQVRTLFENAIIAEIEKQINSIILPRINQLTAQLTAFLADPTALVPAGIVVPWTKAVAQIPTGWHVADGTSGTVDLRNRFIVGAGATYNQNATGGSTNPSISVSQTTLTVDQIPSHKHIIPWAEGYENDFVWGYTGNNKPGTDAKRDMDNNWPYTSPIGGGQAHTHAVSYGSLLPPYIALVWIQKV